MTVHSPLLTRQINTYRLGQIGDLLGYQRKDARSLRDYVTALIAERGFPPPLPSLAFGRGPGALTDAVTVKSHWVAAAVDAWLDNYLPPAAGAAREAVARTAAAAEMDAMAGSLGERAAGHLRLIAGNRA